MLTRTRTTLILLTCLALSAGLTSTPAPVYAGGGNCSNYGECSVEQSDGGGGRGGNSGGKDSGPKESRSSTCVHNGKDIPCATGAGRWSYSKGCYVKKIGAMPKPDGWDGMSPEERAKWQADNPNKSNYSCTTPGGGSSQFIEDDTTFASSYFPQINPEDLARRALARLKLSPISIGIAPKTSDIPKDKGIVGMPVWLWAGNPASNTTGPAAASASDSGITVSLKAHVGSYRWSMGDGKTVRCTNKGTPWKPGMTGNSPSGCGYNYLKSGKYQVSATTTWKVEWEGGGMRGTITLPLTSTPETMHVTEAQTVVVR